MTAKARMSLQIDQEAGAAYLQFSDALAARTVEFSEEILVDLDEHGVVIGIEILDLAISVPLDDLNAKFHIRTEALAVLLQSLRSSTTSRHVGRRHPTPSRGVLAAQPVATPASCA